MKRFIALLVAVVLFFTSSVSYADSELNLPDVPKAVLTPMEKDDKAPYQGVLLSADAIANIIADYKAFDEKLRIELERVQGEADAQKRFELGNLKAICDADKKILQTQIDKDARDKKMLIDRQKKLEKASKNVLLFTLLGAGAGVLVAGLGFYGVSQLR